MLLFTSMALAATKAKTSTRARKKDDVTDRDLK